MYHSDNNRNYRSSKDGEDKLNILDCAYRYLEHRPRTESEMIKHLTSKGFETEEISDAVKELKSFRYIDDVEYGIMYLRYGFNKGRGLRRVRFELAQKGLSPEMIESAIFAYEDENEIDLDDADEERAFSQGKKMLVNESKVDEKVLAKLGRRLDRLGYSTSIIYKVINHYKSVYDI